MKIAIYLDTPALTDIAIRAARAAKLCHPFAEVVHLNGGPESFDIGADTTLHCPVDGTFCRRRAVLQGMVEGEALFIGADVICQENVSYIFEQDFDVAIATDIRPGHPSIKYNADVVFCRTPAFWQDIESATGAMGWPDGDWMEVENAYRDIVDSGKYRTLILPGETYNYVPVSKDDYTGNRKIVHYRGQRKNWLSGRLHPVEFLPGLNTPESVMVEHIRQNLKRDTKMILQQPPHDGEAVLVGGGASLNDLKTLSALRQRVQHGAVLFALNNSYQWLVEHNFQPKYHVLLDARQENAEFIRPDRSVTYLIASQCHPDVFDKLAGYDVVQWVGWMPGIEQAIDGTDKPVVAVGGGGTVGLRAMSLAVLLGFRDIRLFGYDSCHQGHASHAYQQELNARQALIEIVCGGKTFLCSRSMAKQAQDFQPLLQKMIDAGCEVKVYGSGLIPHIMKQMEVLSCSTTTHHS